jgi:hypothetical protein
MRYVAVRRLALAAVAAASMACASGGASSANAGDSSPKHDRTVITDADMRELTVSNLLEVVQHLHPEWLTPRNAGTVAAPRARTASSSTDVAVQVYIDTQHAGTIDVLGQLSINSAASLKYYSASEAQARFGNGNIYGAIQIISPTKR